MAVRKRETLHEDHWTGRYFTTEKEAKLGVIASGYRLTDVEFYEDNGRYRFRLTEAALADQEASWLEDLPMKPLPEHLKLKPRKKLDETHQLKRLRLQGD